MQEVVVKVSFRMVSKVVFSSLKSKSRMAFCLCHLNNVSRMSKVQGIVSHMLGQNLITKQTPPEGVPVRKVFTISWTDEVTF
jgi:hypothetical protein